MFISQGARDLGQSMMHKPEGWGTTGYEFVNRDMGIIIWTANGILSMSIKGVPSLNLFERYYINRCIKQSIANKLSNSCVIKL